MMSDADPRQYRARPDLLADRVIIVTGAGSGIGRAAALDYAAHGATCVLLGRNVRDLESVYDEIVAARNPEPAIYPLDHLGASPEDYQEMAGRLHDQLGRLDGLLVNAGLLGTIGPIEHAEPKEFSEVLHVNVTAGFLTCHACLPLLREAPGASIILTTSGLGQRGKALWGAYCVSKFAIEGFTQVLADELSNTNVRVNAINPGATRTAMRASAFPAEDPRELKTPAQIMPTYLYLMGSDSPDVRGQTLNAQ
jgi:NAD(P)-dependent dehydrogenase (short-subunit alcohol dehydrogenase family)